MEMKIGGGGCHRGAGACSGVFLGGHMLVNGAGCGYGRVGYLQVVLEIQDEKVAGFDTEIRRFIAVPVHVAVER